MSCPKHCAPAWTADGSILFTSILTDGAALFTVHPDGSDLTKLWEASLTKLWEAPDAAAVWQPVDVDPASIAARAAPTPTPAATPFALPKGTVAFASNRTGEFHIDTMNLDGTNLQQITFTPGGEAHPSFSPADARIAYDAPVSNTRQLFAVRIGSSETLTLTQATWSSMRPAWSPDGTRIAFQARDARNNDIAVINADGSGLRQLTSQPGFEGCLSWRPDGDQIAFASDAGGNQDVYVMNPDGSNVKRLTQHRAADHCPAWRPDGKQIAFVSDRGDDGVYVMNPDGSGVRLIATIAHASQPAWSPDGKFVLVSSDQSDDGDIYLIAIDTGAIRNITHTPDVDEVDPVWKP